ncbi:MAG: hypothetical protein Rhob2KO_17250 [Rhodopirellula baltica]
MAKRFSFAVQCYQKAKKHSKGTSDECKGTVRKWISWAEEISLEQLSRSSIRDLMDRVYDHAVEHGGENAELTSNKARDHVRAVAAWAWENDIIESLPPVPQTASATQCRLPSVSEQSGTELTLLCHVSLAPTPGVEETPVHRIILAISNRSIVQ